MRLDATYIKLLHKRYEKRKLDAIIEDKDLVDKVKLNHKSPFTGLINEPTYDRRTYSN